ncbi:hypothetical protein MKX03_032621 [Papaver bracteatum]|nr:hypothetical protein MKX03_032621 [Papaver bracteatum]
MESKPSTRVVAKRVWNIVKIVFFMIRKGISKNNKFFIVHLQNIMSKREKIATKVIENMMFHYQNSKKASQVSSYKVPKHYEFGNSPAVYMSNNNCKQKNHGGKFPLSEEDMTTVNAVQQLLEMLNNEVMTENGGSTILSPHLPGFGFGRTPTVRQFRITDSPFPLKDHVADEEECQVDEDADEFIKNFYAQLSFISTKLFHFPLWKKKMDPNNTKIVAKRLWNILRLVFFMIRRGISKNNKQFMFHLHSIMSKRNKVASKVIANLMIFHHHQNSNSQVSSFKIPRHYEFSCSNSPAIHMSNGKHKMRGVNLSFSDSTMVEEDDITTVSAVHKLLEMLNNEVMTESGGSTMPSPYLPGFGFGRSPVVRQLRITDSPFPLRDNVVDESECHVDEDAEEFIERFYEQLRLQKNKMAYC